MKKILLFSLVVLLLNAFVFSETTPQDKIEAKYYDNAKVLRIKYATGETFVKRSYDDGLEEGTANLPIFEKDRVGTTDGRIELYMGRLNYVRLDVDTEVEFTDVPQLRKTNMHVRVIKGGIYLDISSLDYEKDIEIQTPDCGVFVLDKGLYRINVDDMGRTEVYIFEGLAEVAGQNYSRNVRENQKIVMYQGQVKESPFYFSATNKDDFDSWNGDRNSSVGYARYGSSRYLSKGYEDYEHELSRSGRWVYSSEFTSHVWVPYNVDSTWRPYSHGRWVWNPYYGYVWSSYDSWGYFTHHYGRWHWDPYLHWHWIPGYHWSPAWVSWFWDDSYYGWCPLSYWNRPVIILNNRWNRYYRYRHGIPHHSRSIVVIKKRNLYSSNIRRVVVPKATFSNHGKKALHFRGAAPKVKPAYSKIGVINARGKRMAYKDSGFIHSKRYKTVTPRTGVAKTKKTTLYKYSGTNNTSKRAFKYSRSTSVRTPNKKYPTSRTSVIKKTKSPVSSSSYQYKKYKSSSKSSDSSKRYSTPTKKRSSSTSSTTKRYSTPAKKRSSSTSSTSKRTTSKRSSSSKSRTVKKKKHSPSYSTYYRSSPSTSSSSNSYSSSSSSNSTYKRKSYSSPSSSSRSNSGYKSKSYSSPSSSYKSSSRSKSYSSSSSSYKRPSKSYSSSSSRSYKSSGSSSKSYKRSSRSSSSYKRSSSSSRSSSRSSSSRSSSRSSSKSSRSGKRK